MMKIEDQPSEFWEMIDAAFFLNHQLREEYMEHLHLNNEIVLDGVFKQGRIA